MRENRTCGSEGGEAQSLPYPYHPRCRLQVGAPRGVGADEGFDGAAARERA